MRDITERHDSSADEVRPSWGRRLGWLALIWVLSVAALGVVALLLRLVMNAAGLTT